VRVAAQRTYLARAYPETPLAVKSFRGARAARFWLQVACFTRCAQILVDMVQVLDL
jgi:hypothetical protein